MFVGSRTGGMPGKGEAKRAPAGLGVGVTVGVADGAALGAKLAPPGDGAMVPAEGDGASARAAGDGATLGVTCVQAPTASTSPRRASPHRRRVDLVAWAAM